MFFKSTTNNSRQSHHNPTEPSYTRPSSFNKENYLTRNNDITPIESRLSLQSSNFKLFNRSGKIPHNDKPHHTNSAPKLQDFLKKVSNYLTISNVLIEEAESTGNTSGTLLRQIKKLGDRIEDDMEEFKGVQTSNNCNFQEREWSLIKNQLLKRIQQLESQVQRMNLLVEDHQENNLKIMIKMNEAESGNISYFKTQLQQSFQAYKILEDKVQVYKQKIKQIENIKILVQRDNQKKAETISYLQKQLLKNPKDRRSSLNESKGIKGLLMDKKIKQKERQKVRYNDSSVVNSITSSVKSNYTSNNVSINGGMNSNNYLKCGEITELEDFISD